MDKATKFFHSIYKHTPDKSHAHIAWGDVFSPLFPTVEEVLEGAVTVDQTINHYFTPAVLREPRRVKANVWGSSVAWAEVDDYKSTPLRRPLLPPSFVINSGKGQHLYWLLDNFYEGEALESANRSISHHLGIKGEGCWDRNRLLRVPGSLNNKYLLDKYKESYDGPLPVEVVGYYPENVYSITDLIKLRPYNPGVLVPPENGTGQDTSQRDWELGILLRNWNLAEYAIRAALLEVSEKAQKRQDYLDITIKKLLANREAEAAQAQKVDDADSLFNVSITPRRQLVDGHGADAGLVVTVAWGNYAQDTVATGTDFASRAAVIRWLSRLSDTRIYTGTDKQALLFWRRLVEQCPPEKQLRVEHAGRVEVGDDRMFVVSSDSAVVRGQSDAAVLWLPKIRTESEMQMHLAPAGEGLDTEAVAHLLSCALQAQLPEIIYPSLGWVFAVPFKPVIEEVQYRFPALMLYGTRGSGKTSLIQHVLLPMLGIFTSAMNSDTTLFSALGHLCQGHWPVWFGEFRNSNRNSIEFQQILRSVYDTGYYHRGRSDLSVSSFKLAGAPIIDGEDPFGDSANLERTVSLRLDRRVVEKGSPQSRAFHQVRKHQQFLLQSLARAYVEWSLEHGPDYVATIIEDYLERLVDKLDNTSRVVHNTAVVMAGFRFLKDFTQELDIDVDIPLELEPFAEAVAYTFRAGLGVTNYADKLVGRITHFPATPGLDAIWDPETGILWFNVTRALYAFRDRQVSEDMLTLQLEERLNHYMVGPEYRHGSLHFGIDVQQAQQMGLDVKMLEQKPELETRLTDDGRVKVSTK